MGQKLFDDKIGTLNYSAGNIVMSATLSNPSYLTIGGQQYKITSALSAAANVSAASTRYQVYAVVVAGVVNMVISQNENSVGPSGHAYWKLIGSYMSNSKDSIGFGSFLNIEGKPVTENAIKYDMHITGSISDPAKGITSPGYDDAYMIRDGEDLLINYDLYNAGGAGTAGSGVYLFNLPVNLVFDVNKRIAPGNLVQPVVGAAEANNGGSNGTGHVMVYDSNGTSLFMAITATSVPQALIVGSSHYALVVITTYSFQARLPIVGWSSKPIKDL